MKKWFRDSSTILLFTCCMVLPLIALILLAGWLFSWSPQEMKGAALQVWHWKYFSGALIVASTVALAAGYSLFTRHRKSHTSHVYLEHNPSPCLITDANGVISFANPAFKKAFPQVETNIDELLPYLYVVSERTDFQKFLRTAPKNKEKFSGLFLLEGQKPSKEGAEKAEGRTVDPVLSHVSCTKQDGQVLWFWMCNISDEQSLLFCDTPFQRALDAKYLFSRTPSSNILIDKDGFIQGINNTFQEHFLKENVAKIGSPLNELLSANCLEHFPNGLMRTLEDKKRGEGIELEFAWGDTVVAYISPLSFGEEVSENGEPFEGYYLQLFDNSDQRDFQMRVAHSQKLQALGQLAGGIAHDFNNLLTAMIGFCDLLLMRLSPGDQSFTDIMQIKQNANRATNLVRQLLAFSRQQTLQPTVLDVSEVLSDLSVLLQRLIGSSIELKIVHDRDVDFIKVDRSQFEQVVINLVVNARDAISETGVVRLVTSLRTFDKKEKFDHEEIQEGSYVQIEVIDDGQGISKENIARVFDPFFSTKDLGDGTGLGLSTVYGTVKQTGGYIAVDSTVGVGTKFTILLPQYVGAKTAKPASDLLESNTGMAEPTFKDLTGHAHILIAEDEDAVRLFAARALSDKGYKVNQAQNGLEALEYLKSLKKNNQSPPDLLITDVVMPKMDGPTLVKEAAHVFPEMKVMYVSGYAEDAFRDMVRLEEKIRFLAKPFSLKVLATRVKETLEENQAKFKNKDAV